MVNKIKGGFEEKATTTMMILPSVIALTLFSLYPITWMLKFMFFEVDMGTAPIWIGMENFARILRDKDFWNSIVNTGVYALGKLALTIPLALLLAIVLNGKVIGKNFIRAAIFIPTVMSTAIMSLVFYFIFNSYNGIINQLLLKYQIVDTPIEWLGSKAMLTVIVVSVWGGLGNYMVYFLAGLQNIPMELYESAKIDGASKIQEVRHITLPLLLPVFQIVMLLAVITSLRDYENIMVLTGGGPGGRTSVMYLYAFNLFFPSAESGGTVMQYGYGAAVSFVIAIIIGIVTAIYYIFSKKTNKIY